MDNPLLKTLIVVSLAYYLIKGLIYLLLWQTTYKLQQNALEAKKKKREKKMKRTDNQTEDELTK